MSPGGLFSGALGLGLWPASVPALAPLPVVLPPPPQLATVPASRISSEATSSGGRRSERVMAAAPYEGRVCGGSPRGQRRVKPARGPRAPRTLVVHGTRRDPHRRGR